MNKKSLRLILLLAVMGAVCAAGLFLNARNVSFCPGADGTVAVRIKRNAIEETVRPWYCEAEDTYYLFLPSALCGREIYGDQLEMPLYIDGEEIPKRGRFAWEDGQTCHMTYGDFDGNVKFMASSGLPSVFINTEAHYRQQVNADKTAIVPGALVVFDEKGSISYNGGMTISGRGNSTYTLFEKKPYNIELYEPACILGMTRDRDWCLLANTWDYSYMNNKLAYDMAEKAGFRYVPDAEYADVYFNGDYQGIYLVAEKVEVNRDRVRISDLKTANENANPGTVIAEAEKFDEGSRRGVLLENVPADITGGYLLERDYRLDADYPSRVMTASYFETEGNGTAFNIKSPEYADLREVEYIRALTSEMEQAILAENGVSETGKHYLDYIDLTSWVRCYMIAEIAYDLDKDVTNTYYYKNADVIDSRFYSEPVWDYDNRFGGAEKYSSAEVLTRLAYGGWDQTGGWSQYLYEKPEFFEAVCREWNTFFRKYLSEEAPGMIDSWREQTGRSVAMDLVRWPRGENSPVRWPGSDGFSDRYSYDEAVEYLKDWIGERCAFLDAYWGETREGSSK